MDGERAAERRGPYREGEAVVLVDGAGRRYLVRLRADGQFRTHLGVIPHREIIGRPEGSRLLTHTCNEFLSLRPTLEDYVLKMPRRTQVVYPKDLGMILVLADVKAGDTVVEAGIGSGALSTALLRAVGPGGRLISYEAREEFIQGALANIRALVPDWGNHTVHHADVYQGIRERDVDAVVLDLPEPWRAVPAAAEALRPGGVFLAYLPTVLQVHELAKALAAEPRFALASTREVLERPWSVGTLSVRPAHRMVAHTAFLITARRAEPSRRPPEEAASAPPEPDAEEPEA